MSVTNLIHHSIRHQSVKPQSIRCQTGWFFLTIVVGILYPVSLPAVERPLDFDVPAMAPANVLEVVDDYEKIVEIILPVSLIRRPSPHHLDEIRIQVSWNGIGFPVVDYGPRTEMYSEISGDISIEKKSESSQSFGLDLNGTYSVVSGGVDAKTSNKNLKTTRFIKTPKQDVLISSGTSNRGTGVAFRFRPSHQTTLEGGRELVIAFAVPVEWRAGILNVTCHATGKRPVLGTLNDPFNEGVAFVLPVYLHGDRQARQTAFEFAQAERRLRENWKRQAPQSEQTRWTRQLKGLFGRPDTSSDDKWVHGLIQSGDDSWLEQYSGRTSSQLRQSARQFIESRQQVVAMNGR